MDFDPMEIASRRHCHYKGYKTTKNVGIKPGWINISYVLMDD